MNLNNPPLLKKGDSIGIVSPSAGLAPLFPHRIINAQKQLESLGFAVKFSPHAQENAGYVSASAQERAKDLMQMFEDPEVKLIMAAIGGNHSNQILKYLDFASIAAHPKIFMGYSDITVLHYSIATQSGLRTFYGPTAMPEFGEYPNILPYTLEYFKRAVMRSEAVGAVTASEAWTDELLNWGTQEDLTRPRKLEKNNGYEWWQTGEAQGPIVGGAIPSVNHLAGTKYWIDPTNCIFFIDLPEGDAPGTPLSFSHLDSYLADLDNIDVFSKIAGLIIGRPYGYKPKDAGILKEMVAKYTRNTSYPILYNANIGHTAPIISLPFGAATMISSQTNTFAILENGVVES